MVRPTKRAFIKAMHQHKGSRKALSEHYGVDPTTIWRWIKHFDLKDEIGAYAHEIDYDAKAGLAQRIRENDWTAITFWYNTVRDKVIQDDHRETDRRGPITIT